MSVGEREAVQRRDADEELEHIADRIEEVARFGHTFTNDERRRLMGYAWNIKLVARGGKSV